MSDTLRRMNVTLSNPGKARVEYSWAWVRQDGGGSGAFDLPEPSSAALAGRALGSTSSVVGGGGPGSIAGGMSRYAPSIGAGSSKAAAAPGSLFDILPIRGTLGPGESESAEVSFYGYPGVKAAAAAVCKVVDGPEYQVRAAQHTFTHVHTHGVP